MPTNTVALDHNQPYIVGYGACGNESAIKSLDILSIEGFE